MNDINQNIIEFEAYIVVEHPLTSHMATQWSGTNFISDPMQMIAMIIRDAL